MTVPHGKCSIHAAIVHCMLPDMAGLAALQKNACCIPLLLFAGGLDLSQQLILLLLRHAINGCGLQLASGNWSIGKVLIFAANSFI